MEGGAIGMAEGIITAFTAAFTAVQGDVNTILIAAVPVAAGIAGTLFVARGAFKWFKSMAK